MNTTDNLTKYGNTWLDPFAKSDADSENAILESFSTEDWEKLNDAMFRGTLEIPDDCTNARFHDLCVNFLCK